MIEDEKWKLPLFVKFLKKIRKYKNFCITKKRLLQKDLCSSRFCLSGSETFGVVAVLIGTGLGVGTEIDKHDDPADDGQQVP